MLTAATLLATRLLIALRWREMAEAMALQQAMTDDRQGLTNATYSPPHDTCGAPATTAAIAPSDPLPERSTRSEPGPSGAAGGGRLGC